MPGVYRWRESASGSLRGTAGLRPRPWGRSSVPGRAGSGQPGAEVTNQGLIEGVSDAPGIRDRIMARVRRSRTAGLDDERDGSPAPAWSPAHLELLREVRDEVAALRG